MRREIDAAVAEKVMGWKHQIGTTMGNPMMGTIHVDPWETPEGDFYAQPPHYSTDIAAAWQVVENLRIRDGCWIEIGNADPKPDAGWFCTISTFVADGNYRTFTTRAKTAAMAICLAALKSVVGVESK